MYDKFPQDAVFEVKEVFRQIEMPHEMQVPCSPRTPKFAIGQPSNFGHLDNLYIMCALIEEFNSSNNIDVKYSTALQFLKKVDSK